MIYRKDDVVVDALKSFKRDGREKVICYRESHRNFYVFILQLSFVIIALTTYGVFTQVRLSRRLGKTNKEIDAQKKEIEEKNSNIMASIRYAERIQKAMLPTQQQVELDLGDAFVYMKPKDMVSGDFFWVGRQGANRIMVAADCTGHGVPGAFLASVGYHYLSEILEAGGELAPNEILERLNDKLSTFLRRNETQENEYEDGMEMTIAIVTRSLEVHFAGAKQQILLVTNGELKQYKGDRITLGSGAGQHFTLGYHQMQAGDSLYLFSDGYQDRFGGPETKKYSKAKLISLLGRAAGSSAQEQRQQVAGAFTAWKGSQPQTDDVLVMGMNV